MKKYFLFLLLNVFFVHLLVAQSYESKSAKKNNEQKNSSVKDTIIKPDKNTNTSVGTFFEPESGYDSKVSNTQKKNVNSIENTVIIKTPEMRTPDKNNNDNPE